MENKPQHIKPAEEEITRKDAIKKVGKYAAFTAVGMLVLLSPKASQAASPNNPTKPPLW